MDIFTTLFQYYLEFSSNAFAIIPVQIISFMILGKIIINLAHSKLTHKNFHYEKALFVFFIIPIVAIMLDNIVLIAKFFIPKSPLYRSINCLAWIFSGIKFYSLILFLEKLVYKKIIWNWYHKSFLALEFLLCCSFIFSTVHAILHNESYHFVIIFYYIVALFSFASILIMILQQLSNQALPVVLKKQLKTLLIYFLCPHFICILLELMPIVFFDTHRIIAFSNLGTILITASIYFCFKRIMQFRFLNLSNHVQMQSKIDATADFKEVVEQINISTTTQELQYITQNFCKEQLHFDHNQVTLFIRSVQNNTHPEIQTKIEQFLTEDIKHLNTIETLFKHKILIRHEIEFDEFYTNNVLITHFAQFLKNISCDIFVPIFHNKQLLAYIAIANNEQKSLYNAHIQNQLMVFAQFLAPAIYFIQHQDTNTLLQETKTIKQELHNTKQEIAQYKESLKKLLKDRIENHVGIFTHKNKLFAFKNQQAQELLMINPNVDSNHPTSVTLTNFAEQIEKYQAAQTLHLTLSDGNKLMITGMPQNPSVGGSLFIIQKPDATDILRMHLDAVKNDTDHDYLLYLQTTQAGQMINALLPSNHELFLQIKIQLLKSALQKNTIFLQMHTDDIDYATTIMHNINNKHTLHTLNLTTQNESDAIILFGINSLLNNTVESCLLEKSHMGTIVIKNIEHLAPIYQQKLAHYIRYGIFTPIKSEQRKFSDTRIICTSTLSLKNLHQDMLIVSELYQELHKNHVAIPSLVTMSDTDLLQLIDGCMYQHLQQKNNSLRGLLQHEKMQLIAKRIPSIFELNQKIKLLMAQPISELEEPIENKKNINFSHTTCPEIQLAAQLGKHALKDVQLMKALWKQLGNQTKIADLLGVNRSSVNRRCKEYNLM